MDPDRLLDVLGNEHARAVLVAAADGPSSVEELTARTDASRPTVYRQVDALRELDLLRERRGFRDGTHYRTYETTVEELSLSVTPDGVDAAVEARRDPSSA